MKRFILKLVTFIIVVAILAICIDYIVSKGLAKTQRGHFFTMNTIMNDTINADVLILGNSRAHYGYDPRPLDSILHVNTWNLGVSGQHFGVEYLRYQLYKKKNINPKLIVLNIGPAELGFVQNGYEREQYYPYIHEPLLKPYLEPYSFNWMDVYIPMYRYRGDHKLILLGILEYFNIFHDTKGNAYKGFLESNENWNGTAFKERQKEGTIVDMHEPQAIALLDTFICELKANEIPIVFCYAPIYKELKELLDEEEAINAYNTISQKYCIPILDYSISTICSDTTYFKDSNHLNAYGAELFSIQLAHDLDSLGIISH